MEYLLHIGIMIGIFGILAMSLDLVIGYTGLLSAAHGAFFGIGAYTVAVLTTRYDVGFFSALFLGMIIAGIIAGLLGLVLSRFRDDYYVLATLGISVIVYNLFLNLENITRGPLGIPGIPRPELWGMSLSSNVTFLIAVLAVAGLVALFLRTITRMPFGYIIRAIREDEEAIAVFGVRTTRFKLVVFIIAAAIAAIAGGFFASYITFIDPSSFGISESVFIIAIVILGGLGNIRGAFLGAVVMILLPEVLRFVGFPTDIAAQMRHVIYGLMLTLFMLYRPQGMWGEYKL